MTAAEATGREVRQDVAEVLVRYASGIDRRDWALLRTCFTDDCETDYGTIGTWHGAGAIADWMQKAHARCGTTMHRVSNPDITRDGDRVTARSYCDAIVLMAGNQAGTRAVGIFDDDLVLTGQGWKIARRRYTLVLAEHYSEGRFGGLSSGSVHEPLNSGNARQQEGRADFEEVQ